MNRFIAIQLSSTYIGGLNTERVGTVVHDYVSKLPNFFSMLKGHVDSLVVGTELVLSIDVLIYVNPSILTESEFEVESTKIRTELSKLVSTELKSQKIIFRLEPEL